VRLGAVSPPEIASPAQSTFRSYFMNAFFIRAGLVALLFGCPCLVSLAQQPGCRLVYLPFILVLAGLSLGGTALFGMQTMMFGFGFHF
jgi:hypothetical protein